MLDGAAVVGALLKCGVTHIIWIPDSSIGAWESAIVAEPRIGLVRPCREGEAIGIAGGLWMGGAQPVVVMQCTGLFEAGDALRNLVHDMGVPLFFVIGVRSWYAHQQGTTADNCPVFTEPILRAWQVPYVVLEQRHTAEDLAAEYRKAQAERRPGAVLIAE
jgi:sulfopyruvate decarboxylase TPP-binding subunit